MTAEEFLETKKLKLSKNMYEGYVIPYSYLKTLLEEYTTIKINGLNKQEDVRQRTKIF